MDKKEILDRWNRGEREFDIARKLVSEHKCSYSTAHEIIRKAVKGRTPPLPAIRVKVTKRTAGMLPAYDEDWFIRECAVDLPDNMVVANLVAYYGHTEESALELVGAVRNVH